MVYFSDLPGHEAFDEQGVRLGLISAVSEAGAQELLVIRTPRGDVSVPWNDRFVKRIDSAAKRIDLDVSTLRGVLF